MNTIIVEKNNVIMYWRAIFIGINPLHYMEIILYFI